MISLKTTVCALLLFSAIALLNSGPALGCHRYKIKLVAILNLLCNSTQTISVQLRQGCTSCFLKAAALPASATQLRALGYCASVFLNNTGYQVCAQQLATVAVQTRPVESIFKVTSCSPGYCEFIRCVRRTNANILINACFLANLVNRDFNRIIDRINFYTNTTACILAKMRCSRLNPITGELQQQISETYPIGLTNSVGTAGYFDFNALQIAPNGDLKVIAFPPSYVNGDFFCTKTVTFEQSTYDNSTCMIRRT